MRVPARRGPQRRGPSVDGRLLAYVPAARRLLWLAVACGFLAATAVIASGLLLSLVIAAVFIQSRPPDAMTVMAARNPQATASQSSRRAAGT